MASTSASQSTFNGPFKKAELLLLPQYAASDVFSTAGKWTGTKNHVLSVDNHDLDAMVPLYCIVVGTISGSRPYLGKHGNFSAKYMDDAQKAKIQFTLARPDDPDFGPDFDKAVASFQVRQRDIADSRVHLHFLLKDESNAMRMNFGLFEPKGDTYDQERERESLAYTVDHQFEPYWSAAKASNYCSIMPVFDIADAPVNPSRFAEKLVGAMCEVTFTLIHYPISSHKKDGIFVEANDVFSAQVETVAILKNAPVLARSPYKGRLTRKPQHRPQLPTRRDQTNSAMAFVPQPDFGQSKLPSLVTHAGFAVLPMPTMSGTVSANFAPGIDGNANAKTTSANIYSDSSATIADSANTALAPIIDASNDCVPGIPSASSTVSTVAVKATPAIGIAPFANVTTVNAIGLSAKPFSADTSMSKKPKASGIKAQDSSSSIGTLISDDDNDNTEEFVQVEIPGLKKRKFVE